MDFGFQDIPGLLTPQMSDNIRNQMLLGAAQGLIKGGGPSPTPNYLGGFADAINGALQARSQGTDAAYKQLQMSEQIRKLMEDRQQREQWQKIFAGGQPDASAAPAPQPAVPGIMSPPGAGPAPAPAAAPQGMPQGVMSSPNAPPIPFLDPATGDPAATPPAPAPMPATAAVGAPVAPAITNTQAGVRSDANANLTTVLQHMPPAMRQMIGVMGPTKGMDALSTYVGKKFDKPSDSFLTVQSADGSTTSNFRADSPALDAAIAAGGKIITTPSGNPSTTFVTVQGADGGFSSFRADSPDVDKAIAAGGKIVTTPSSNPNDRTKKPDAYLMPDGKTVLSTDGLTYTDDNGQKQPIPQAGTIKLGPDTAFEASRSAKVQARAQSALDASNQGGAAAGPPPAENAALAGTGAWAKAWAAFNAVAGGAGLDAAFGQNGFFPQTTANRQYLRDLRQVGKTALVNNPRFPVAEQKNVDELFPDPEALWTNPRTEMQKVPILRNTLNANLTANNEAIAGGGLTKEEQSRLSSNNIEIRRALRMLGPGDASLGALGDAPPATGQPAPAAGGWAAVPVNGIVVQNGRRFQKGADGKAVDIGAAQ